VLNLPEPMVFDVNETLSDLEPMGGGSPTT